MKKTLASIEAEIARLKGMADKIFKDEVAGVVDRIRTAIQHYGLKGRPAASPRSHR